MPERSKKAEQLFVGFTCRNFGPCGAQVEKDREGIQNDGHAAKDKNVIWTLLLFLLTLIATFQQNYHNNHLVLSPNEMVGLYCRD